MNKEKEENQISVEYEITVRNKDGDIIEQRREKSESFVKNFLLLLNAAFRKTSQSVVDTGGTPRSIGAEYSLWTNYVVIQNLDEGGGWSPAAPIGNDTYGILIGTSNTPVSVDDYNLGAKIEHGDGVSGKMYHHSVNLYDPTVDGAIVKQKFDRAFFNNSGAGITVKEIGLVLGTFYTNQFIMIIRDVITPVTVPDGSIITITYFIRTGSG